MKEGRLIAKFKFLKTVFLGFFDNQIEFCKKLSQTAFYSQNISNDVLIEILWPAGTYLFRTELGTMELNFKLWENFQDQTGKRHPANQIKRLPSNPSGYLKKSSGWPSFTVRKPISRLRGGLKGNPLSLPPVQPSWQPRRQKLRCRWITACTRSAGTTTTHRGLLRISRKQPV